MTQLLDSEKRPELSVPTTRGTKVIDKKYALTFSGKKELVCVKCNGVIDERYLVSRLRNRKGRIRRIWDEGPPGIVYYHITCWERLFL